MKLLKALFLLLALTTMIACSNKSKVLHLIQSPSGKISGNSEMGYTLTLNKVHDTVIWFTERPNRKAGYIRFTDFLQTWDEGRDSFAKDPPNAVLIIGNSEPIVLELVLLNWDKKRVTFALKPIQGNPMVFQKKSGPVMIYVDADMNKVNPQVIDSLRHPTQS